VKNVTIVLDEEVARWVRIRAAEHDTSVSRFVGDLLRQMMEEQQQYEQAWNTFSSVQAKLLRKRGETLPARDDVHERDLR
jgi:plasmid stability protein